MQPEARVTPHDEGLAGMQQGHVPHLAGLAARERAGFEEDGGGRLLGGSRGDLLAADKDAIKERLRAHLPQLAALDLRVPDQAARQAAPSTRCLTSRARNVPLQAPLHALHRAGCSQNSAVRQKGAHPFVMMTSFKPFSFRLASISCAGRCLLNHGPSTSI